MSASITSAVVSCVQRFAFLCERLVIAREVLGESHHNTLHQRQQTAVHMQRTGHARCGPCFGLSPFS